MFLVCILSVSAISATQDTTNEKVTSIDNNENDLETNIRYDDVSTSNNNDELILEENNGQDEEIRFRTDKTTANDDPLTFTDLNTIINDNDNSTIYLSHNYKYNNASDTNFINGITINRDLTIYGNGVTLDGIRCARIFDVTNSKRNVNFYNIIFINGKSEGDGGAIYRGNAINCTFIGNNARRGGSIANGNAYNCTFIGNNR